LTGSQGIGYPPFMAFAHTSADTGSARPPGYRGAGAEPAVVLVTGASRGLGRGVAGKLAADGHSVVVNYASNRQAAEETLRICESARRSDAQRFEALAADVGSRRDRDNLLARALELLGRVDALVNNAGMAPRVRQDIVEAEEESFEELMRVNLQGPYFLTQAVARYWLSERPEARLPGGFKIIFVGSISAHTASVNRGEYCVSKAGLSMAAQLWAVRLAAEGIQVVELRPGIMATDMTRAVKDRYDVLISEGLVPERRWGTGEDLGAVAAAVIRGDLPFITGSVIDVDGGFHLRRL
jgi:3-oxoacyl-[acyl-carrier protein] reductase